MANIYLRWLMGLAVVILVFVIGACTRHRPGSANSIPPARDTRNPEPFVAAVYDERKLDFARYAIHQLNHVVNGLNFALNHRLDERMVISNQEDSLVFGCRLVNKLSPAFERDFDASVEELRVLYVKCEPESSESTPGFSALMNGQAVHTIVYDKPYPRIGAPDLLLGSPVYVGQRTGPLNIMLNHGSGSKTKIARIARVSANRIESTDTEAVFRLSGEITDVYSQERAASEGPKNGRIQVEFGDVLVRVLKSSRRVISLKIGSFSLKARPESIQLSSVAASNSQRDETIELFLMAPEALSPVDLPCRPIAGRFQVYVGGNAMGALTVSDGKIAFEDQADQDFRLCEKEEDVFFFDEFERIFK